MCEASTPQKSTPGGEGLSPATAEPTVTIAAWPHAVWRLKQLKRLVDRQIADLEAAEIPSGVILRGSEIAVHADSCKLRLETLVVLHD